jgi:5-deoxy-glucuronate isomerase
MPPSDLLIKPNLAADNRRVIHVTPTLAGWTYVGFDVWKLTAGESAAEATGEREACLVFLSGKATVEAGGRNLGVVGERASPFDGKPWCVYVPAGSDWKVTAAGDVEFGVCSAPAKGGKAVRMISPDELKTIERGTGTNLRLVTGSIPTTGASTRRWRSPTAT